MRSSAPVRARLALASLLFAACGGGSKNTDDGDGGPSCAAPGTAEVTGTAAGASLTPISAATYFPLATQDGFYALDLNGPGAECGDVPAEGEPPNRLSLLFCDPVMSADYDVLSGGSFPTEPCPGEAVALALVEDAFDGGDIESSASGYVLMDATESCLSGEFEIALTGGDILRGSFNAYRCDQP